MKCTGKSYGVSGKGFAGLRLWRKNRGKKAMALLAAALFIGGCGTKTYELEHPYDIYGTKIHYQQPADAASDTIETMETASGQPAYFAKNLCVAQDATVGKQTEHAQYAQAAGVFHLESGETTYSKNIYEKLYPASTTKIMTAYIALKYGTLSDEITISPQAADQLSDSSVCDVNVGDKLTLKDLLYGLMLKSGNDAADAIAEYISGDETKFAEKMNEEAAALGATRSHFVNPHGLHDENHYTCVYDLYLIFHAALQYEEFEKIIKAKEYTATYKDANGLSVTQVWPTSNLFLTGEAQKPKKTRVIGGKTGTTTDAGYCLVLYSKHKKFGPSISIVLKADERDNLYQFMAELLVL